MGQKRLLPQVVVEREQGQRGVRAFTPRCPNAQRPNAHAPQKRNACGSVLAGVDRLLMLFTYWGNKRISDPLALIVVDPHEASQADS